MVAMKAASDNAARRSSRMQLIYNKSRQASITKELAGNRGRPRAAGVSAYGGAAA
jgi:F-type H+-transporting ATPase subunit gamma